MLTWVRWVIAWGHMSGYVKVFGDLILTSTVWRESKEVKLLWMTMLFLANRNGLVEATIPGMAHYSGLTITETEDALKVLSEEDKYSRTQELGGKRVVKTPDGWRVVNYILYRDRMTKEERRDYKRVKQAEYRDRDSKTPVPSVPVVDEFGDPIAAEAQPLAAPSLVSDQAVRRKAPSRISAPRPQDRTRIVGLPVHDARAGDRDGPAPNRRFLLLPRTQSDRLPRDPVDGR
jgi:hypothetical protein